MQQVQRLMRNSLVLMTLLGSAFAYADFKSDIIESCQAYQTGQEVNEINACKLYIDGYIDSSLFTEDGAVRSKSLIANEVATSNYMQRIYRTRTFGRTDMNSQMAQHEFCIPTEYDRKYVASQVAKSMNISRLNTTKLKQVLFETLVTRFPCSGQLGVIQAAP